MKPTIVLGKVGKFFQDSYKFWKEGEIWNSGGNASLALGDGRPWF